MTGKVRDVDTPDGPARLRSHHPEGNATGTLFLAPGHSGQINTRDLNVLAAELPRHGIEVVIYEPAFRVAGKKTGPMPPKNDIGYVAAAQSLGGGAGGRLFVGGRSAGARSACRTARVLGAAGVVALAFPLHPPGRPEKSRLEELLGAQAPVLVLQGEKDPFGGPGEFPSDLPGGSRLIAVPGADHGFRVAARADPPQSGVLDLLVREVVRLLVD